MTCFCTLLFAGISLPRNLHYFLAGEISAQSAITKPIIIYLCVPIFTPNPPKKHTYFVKTNYHTIILPLTIFPIGFV